MGSSLLKSDGAVRSVRTDLLAKLWTGPTLAAVAIAACLLPATAQGHVDYGFSTVDNSAGGGIMDNYVTQELWADTDLRWLGTQFRLELDQGTIYQEELGGTGLMSESNHDLLATTFGQPSLSYDTRIGMNGQAPGSIPGGAVNLGGSPGLQFTESEINIAYSPAGGQFLSGAFNFGTFTLSKDAVGRGALLFSMHSADWSEGGHYAQTFEIEGGVIRLTGEPVDLEDPNYEYSLENFQFVRTERPRRPPPMEEPQEEPPPEPNDPPPVIDLPPDPSPPAEPTDPPVIIEDPGDPTSPPQSPFEPNDPIDDPLSGEPQEPDDDRLLPIWYWTGVGHAIDIHDRLFPHPDGASLAFTELLSTADGMTFTAGRTALYATSLGEPAIPLNSLTEEAADELLATGNWTVRGANLVYASGRVPEPASAVLILLAAGAMMCWWRIKKVRRY